MHNLHSVNVQYTNVICLLFDKYYYVFSILKINQHGKFTLSRSSRFNYYLGYWIFRLCRRRNYTRITCDSRYCHFTTSYTGSKRLEFLIISWLPNQPVNNYSGASESK